MQEGIYRLQQAYRTYNIEPQSDSSYQLNTIQTQNSGNHHEEAMVFLCLSCMFTDTGAIFWIPPALATPEIPRRDVGNEVLCHTHIDSLICGHAGSSTALSQDDAPSSAQRVAVAIIALRDCKFSGVTKTCSKALQKIWNHVCNNDSKIQTVTNLQQHRIPDAFLDYNINSVVFWMIFRISYAISEGYLHLVNASEHIEVAELAPMM